MEKPEGGSVNELMDFISSHGSKQIKHRAWRKYVALRPRVWSKVTAAAWLRVQQCTDTQSISLVLHVWPEVLPWTTSGVSRPWASNLRPDRIEHTLTCTTHTHTPYQPPRSHIAEAAERCAMYIFPNLLRPWALTTTTALSQAARHAKEKCSTFKQTQQQQASTIKTHKGVGCSYTSTIQPPASGWGCYDSSLGESPLSEMWGVLLMESSQCNLKWTMEETITASLGLAGYVTSAQTHL